MSTILWIGVKDTGILYSITTTRHAHGPCKPVCVDTFLPFLFFRGDYGNALIHYEKGITKLKDVSRLTRAKFQ